MQEKLQSLRPSKAATPTATTPTIPLKSKPIAAPTIPSRRKKQIVKEKIEKPVKVRKERVQVKQEMTASGPFALGPAARGERGTRISMTTTSIRQATSAEMKDNLSEGEKSEDSEESEDDDQSFGPRQIKSKKAKNLKNPLGLGIESLPKPSLPKPPITEITTTKRAMVIESDDEEDANVDVDIPVKMEIDTAEATSDSKNNEFMYFQFPLQMPLGSEELPEGEIGEIQVYDSGRMTCTINNVVFDLVPTDLPDYPQEVCVIEDNEMVVLGSIGSKFVATPDIDALLA